MPRRAADGCGRSQEIGHARSAEGRRRWPIEDVPRGRPEEKLLLAELESRGVEAKVIDDRELVLAVEHKPELGVDVVLERCIQHGTALYALSVLDTWGVPTVNRYEVAEICGNKLLTTM